MQGISGIVLAGGQGRRMGGVDKGLQLLRGKPMVAWALERLTPQVAEVIVNANQNLEAYAAFGHRVVPDAIGDNDLAVAKTGDQPHLTTVPQGSGVLRSMSEANCFIVLEHARGRVQAGETVQVQPFESLV